MIRLIHIENIAVIERAELTFGQGFNVLTGETGAGKSIVIDALSAVTGGRVSRELVRTGADAAMVTAVFSDVDMAGWLSDNGVAEDDDGAVYMSRRVTADGKGACRVNGAPVSTAQLRELGELLIDIHGQNDGRKLLDDASHLGYLDAFGGYAEILREYGEAYALLRGKRAELDAVSMDEGEKERLADMLRHQIDELESANIQPGELARLEERRALLTNASKLTRALDGAYRALRGGEDADGAISLIAGAQSDMEEAVRYSDSFAPNAAQLRDLRYTMEDAAENLRARMGELEFSPEELESLEDRRARLLRVMRMYGGDEESALRFLAEQRDQLAGIEASDERIRQLSAELDGAVARAGILADELTARRAVAADGLKARIAEQLECLNMAGVVFEVEFEPVSGEFGLSARGRENARFLMSANAGQAPGRISRIASGGELSRIMLAMKNVLIENDGIGAMVFDEVDAGVSGIAAQRVAEKLCDLSRGRQVLCVTHLPQIAAMADTHFGISKRESGGRTVTSVEKLDGDGRELELSRLIGGERVTDTTRRAAREQLDAASEYKRRNGQSG
ncbi:MAG: DNA repair protein RecN [Oscillospiraceae bacterium]|jgi:DNA repair protein RecN (Recombination protein N)|nr:DNA repair protein RecN [Oscillospiraceae bacterium]